MGFFSFKCSKSNLSIPAYPAARCPLAASQVVLVLPDNSTVHGTYDGYGRINGVDVYDLMADLLFGTPKRDLVFNRSKYIAYKRKHLGRIDIFHYDTLIEKKHLVYAPDTGTTLDRVIGMTLNELGHNKDYELTTDFDRANKLIKIVRADHYNGESYDDLKTSKSCPDQGFFYSHSTARKIFMSCLNSTGAKNKGNQ